MATTNGNASAYPPCLDLWDNGEVTKPPARAKGANSDWTSNKIDIAGFCSALQGAIDDDPDGVVLLYSPGAGELDEEQKEKDFSGLLRPARNGGNRKTPEVFSPDGKKVNNFAGILQYNDTTVYLHSRFDWTEETAAAGDWDGERSRYADRFLSYILRHIAVPAALLDSRAPTSGNDLVSLLLPRVFLEQLAKASKRGFYRRYQTIEYNDSRVRGRIDVARHIRCNPMMTNGRVAYSSREYTVDNPLNHLILAAYGVLRRSYGSQLEAYLRNDPGLRAPITALETQLGREDLSPTALRKLMAHAREPVTHPMLRSYEVLRKLALEILRFEGKNPFLRSNASGGRVAGILVPMPRVWERMLETQLAGQLAGGQVASYILQGRRMIIPDLLLRDGATVFDAKYKAGWEAAFERELKWEQSPGEGAPYWSAPGVREDTLQILAYMYVLGRSTGGAIFPYTGGAEPVPRDFRISETLGDNRFWLVPFAVPTEDMDQAAYDEQMDASARTLEEWVKAPYNPQTKPQANNAR